MRDISQQDTKNTNKATTSAAAEGVEDEEALQTRTVVCEAAGFFHNTINQLLADGVMPTSV